jgi:hypothetical protein
VDAGPELLKGIRGAGGSFHIVAEMTSNKVETGWCGPLKLGDFFDMCSQNSLLSELHLVSVKLCYRHSGTDS